MKDSSEFFFRKISETGKPPLFGIFNRLRQSFEVKVGKNPSKFVDLGGLFVEMNKFYTEDGSVFKRDAMYLAGQLYREENSSWVRYPSALGVSEEYVNENFS